MDKLIGKFIIIVWIIGLLFMVMYPRSCDGAEPEPQQQELTFADKAKVAGGICLFGLFWSDPKPDETEYIYDMDNGYVADPIPTGIIKKDTKP